MVEKRWINSNMGYIETQFSDDKIPTIEGLIVIWDILKQRQANTGNVGAWINSNMGYIETTFRMYLHRRYQINSNMGYIETHRHLGYDIYLMGLIVIWDILKLSSFM